MRLQETNVFGGELYLAGEQVGPGLSRQIGSDREIYFDEVDFLPASLDGTVACYERVQHRWGQRRRSEEDPSVREEIYAGR